MSIKELYAARKFKLFILEQQQILKIFSKKAEITNFPEGGMLADCGYRLDAQGFAILICHPDYDPVDVNKPAPLIVAEWREL